MGRACGQGETVGGSHGGHRRQTGPDTCGETPSMQGRDRWDRKASILEGPHPGMHTLIHSFIP